MQSPEDYRLNGLLLLIEQQMKEIRELTSRVKALEQDRANLKADLLYQLKLHQPIGK